MGEEELELHSSTRNQLHSSISQRSVVAGVSVSGSVIGSFQSIRNDAKTTWMQTLPSWIQSLHRDDRWMETRYQGPTDMRLTIVMFLHIFRT